MLDRIHPQPFVICPPDDLVQKNPDLEGMSRRLADTYANAQSETYEDEGLQVVVIDADLQIMGSMLWRVLAIQDDFDTACRDAGEAILPVIIKSGMADIQALPWETLYHPEHGFLGIHPGFTLSRQITDSPGIQPTLEKGPLRVLLFTSLPENLKPKTGRLNVEREQEKMQEALLRWIAKGQVVLEMPDDGRFSTLQDLLKDFQPHVLFLSGHGKFHDMREANEVYGEFIFEDEAGEMQAIKENQIASALSSTSVQAVILSACESGRAASDELSSGLMRKISAQGIPHVIGMRESIVDSAGIEFAHALCSALAQRQRIDIALQTARIAIQSLQEDSSADEGSLGQWCLPMLISDLPQSPLIDWTFRPIRIDTVRRYKNRLGNVDMPAHFVGRRAELRRYKNRLVKGEIHKLLITGPGGQGKTSLAGKLALDMQRRGWRVFAWSARLNKPWEDFESEMEQSLNGFRIQRYNLLNAKNKYERAKLMFALLLEQFEGRIVIFLDNLESVQDPHTKVLNDLLIAAWVKAACQTQNLILLTTSRWRLPDWEGENLILPKTNYGDFLQMAQGLGLPSTVLETRGGLRQVYDTLGGNSRGLEFFAAAVRTMRDPNEEQALLETLSKIKVDVQADMAIAEIYQRLSSAAQQLVQRTPVYYEPVPLQGFVLLGPDLPEPQRISEHLLDVSLLEAANTQDGTVPRYQCNPLVKDWLNKQSLIDNHLEWLRIAAQYYFYLFLQKQTLSRAMAAHSALRRAQYADKADHLALKDIIDPLTRAGSYTALLNEWLPPIYHSQDVQARAKALAHAGFLWKNIGVYDKALNYLDQALALQQKILDRAGEARTLNYIASTYQRQGNYEKALSNLQQALAVLQQLQDKTEEAVVLSNIAQIHHGQGHYETALDHLKKALEIQRQTGDQNEGTILNNISQIHRSQGDYETALSYLKQALILQRNIADRPRESVTLNNISAIYQRWNQYETAVKYLKLALSIQRQIGDKPGEGMTLNNLSGIYRRQGELHTAFDFLQEAWAIQKQIGDKAGQSMTLNNLASVYQARGEYQKALSDYQQALAMRRELGDQAGEAQTLINIGTILQSQGEYETARKNFEQSLAIAQAIGSKTSESTALNNIGTVLQAQGAHEMALKYFEDALILTRQIRDQIGEGATLNNIATLYQVQNNDQAALAAHHQALTIRKKIGNQEGEAESLSNLAKIYQAQGDDQTALKYLKLAGTIQNNIGARAGLCITLLDQGHVHRQSGNKKQTIEAWLNAYQLAREMNLAAILQELAQLAPTVGLREGLEDWEALAKQRNPGGK